ncbi:glycosyltransferase [Lapillicoccus jejuensis]|uniref:Galactosyltransferase-like protein n=1 Tax=Lapillicoccus jejuensis TaxID=402171 RepID=A0A542DXK5_9MICO|nr:glycosyltransferase [Lapillicoccus jejuensis]TQJ07807.1 galactosyltransferase-like protein [Lapillicoccus jejuensis]
MTGTGGPRVVHLVVGPERHGVVRHGLLVARTLGHEVVRAEPGEDLPVRAGTDVLHVPVTDRLFAPTAEASADELERLVAPWLAAGAALSVTLHDLPDVGASPLDDRRAAAYRRVLRGARGVVVNSLRELELVAPLLPEDGVASLRGLPLPLVPTEADHDDGPSDLPQPSSQEWSRSVVVLGFVFPDRGYEHALRELPPDTGLVAAGGAAAGHEDLPGRLAAEASAAGRRFSTTGYLPGAALPGVLDAAGVPLAPNRRVGASASVLSWVARGRRPLVPASPYGLELAARMPGAVRLYDPDEPGALRRAVAQALEDPSLTRVASLEGVPTLDEVRTGYDEHLRTVAPSRPHPVGGGRWWVPGNRWDLLHDVRPVRPPSVSVVVPHYGPDGPGGTAQRRLDLVLGALAGQDHDGPLEVVVADDGSPVAPGTGAAGDLPVTVVRQERDGFRAAAARNLGVAASSGEVLLLLDGDTVPEPGYVAALSRLPALLPDALVVGRRRHADLTGWTPDAVAAWFAGAGSPPEELEEPGWLRDAYADSGDLLRVDARSYRHVISAVLGLPRSLWDELGGFDPTFRAYGGEDWELAHRAACAGAVLAHVRDAVAWHDGPDWGVREEGDEALATKNAEVLALSARLPDPVSRGGGSWDRPWAVVVLRFADPVAVQATARALLMTGVDAGVWVQHPDASQVVPSLGDRRVLAGAPPADVLASAVAVLELDRPAVLGDLVTIEDLVGEAVRLGVVGLPAGRVVASWARARAERLRRSDAVGGTSAGVALAGVSRRADRARPLPLRDLDLARVLAQAGRSVRRS